MTDKKLTDAEIVKTLKITIEKQREMAKLLGLPTDMFAELNNACLDLINRLQAEKERLKTEVKLLSENSITAKYPHCVLTGNGAIFTKSLEEYNRLLENISNNVIKEFLQKAEDVFKQKGGNND